MRTYIHFKSFLVTLLICFSYTLIAQQTIEFTKADSLRGKWSTERSCFNVLSYHLDIKILPDEQALIGSNEIEFNYLHENPSIQIDLFENLQIDSIISLGKNIPFKRLHNAIFIDTKMWEEGRLEVMKIYYQGKPIQSKNPPWDGGLIWAQDKLGRPWISVACEGMGASSWWPNKDHLKDEPEEVIIEVHVPHPLVCISNGNLIESSYQEDWNTFTWKVQYPINNYNVSFNVGHYLSFSDPYFSKVKKDTLACDYYVLDYNLEKAKSHFEQTHDALEAFEHYLAPYPFWKDGFALVETPYLGMEHQSAIAYGNKYLRGYLGGMIPRDMDWDYIIVHEGAHEWWGNAVSAEDHAEIWIHESFTTYMEALYVEYHFSYKDMLRYLKGQRRHTNKTPIVGPLGVNYLGGSGSDEYFKGSWIIHTFRHLIGDEIFFPLLKDLYNSFAYQTTNTKDIIQYINNYTRLDYSAFFNQYLYTTNIPTLEYKIIEKEGDCVLICRWTNVLDTFEMPIYVKAGAENLKLDATKNWTEYLLEDCAVKEIEIREELQLILTKKVRE